MYVRELVDVGYAVDLVLVSIEQIVVSQQENYIIEILAKLSQPTHTVVESRDVDS
jgi:hypothetical protein